MRYKNFGSRLVRFVTKHAFDRRTDRQTEMRQQYRVVCIRSRTECWYIYNFDTVGGK